MLLQFIFIVTVFSYKCDPQRAEYPPIPEAYTLRYVQSLVRHGDRAPQNSFKGDNGHFDCSVFDESHIYMNDGSKVSHTASSKRTKIDKENNPYATNYLWSGNCEPSQLTTEGIRQHFELGKLFNEIYQTTNHFLPYFFDSSKIKIRSTGKYRTSQSVQAFLQTFYPINQRKREIDIEISMQPYEIETMSIKYDYCPVIAEIEDKIYVEDKIEELRNKEPFKSTLEKLIRVTGYTQSSYSLYKYVDLLTPRICHETVLPCNENECMSEEDYHILEDQEILENKYWFKQDIAKFQVGMFLEEMLDDYNNAIKENILYQHYSGHDTTIITLISLLGESVDFMVPYASALQFEYVEKDSVMYVRVLFNGKQFELKNLCESNEDGFCTADEFENNLRKFVPTLEECQGVSVSSKRKLSKQGWYTYN